ncbi:hypothetical protein EDC01DRAFT_634454 [Geopyxis carbonaria]|nr:hypothetical protein EDC01DRAFT_634454 [Geopyxis carbonaria]
MNLPSIVHSPVSGQHMGHGHYPTHSLQQPTSYPSHSHGYAARPPAPPPSPPVEDNSKCSLPSISTLLVYADGPQSGSERQQSQPPARVNLPPTPPMRPDSVFDGGHSPTLSASSPSNYYYPTPPQQNRNSYPPAKSPYAPSAESGYPGQQSYYPPQPISIAPTTAPSSSNPWTHHHHSSPASHASFPQSQDRYICQTCNKAFSRPSSLRIHSHSHTGEKPFKCPHHGCGKAFSVRSNMKRHERGCHQ